MILQRSSIKDASPVCSFTWTARASGVLKGVPHSKQGIMLVDEGVLVWVLLCWRRSLLLRKVSPQWKHVVSWDE